MVLEQIIINGFRIYWLLIRGTFLGFMLNPGAPSSPTQWHRFQCWFTVSVAKGGSIKLICIYLWQRNVPKNHMYLPFSQIQGLTQFMGEGNLGRRMQVLSSEEEKELAALMRSQKMFQSRLEGLKGQQEELISLEVLCALRTPA
jgi:hypothetical protein